MTDPVASPRTLVDVTPLLSAREQLRQLERHGWEVTDVSERTVRLSLWGRFHAATEALQLLTLGEALADVRIVGRRGAARIELSLVGGAYEIQFLPEITPDQLFEEPADLARAALAWDRDGEAALELPFDWSIVANLALDRLLHLSPGAKAHVVLSAEPIRATIGALTLAKLSQLFPASGLRTVYVAIDAQAETMHLGSISFVGLGGASGAATFEVPSRAPSLRIDVAEEPDRPDLPAPADLLPVGDVPAAWDEVARLCERLAALVAWALLASDVRLGPPTIVEFMGFKRVRLTLPRPGELEPQAVAQAIALHAWVSSDPSPDRFLAVRQVVSLYQGIDAVQHAGDVLESAQSVFLGLRSDAVAEVIKSTREAQVQAFDTVRQSVKAAQDLAKNSTERVLATLISVGVVVIANAAKGLSDTTGRDLLLLVAAFLFLLALFALAIEGPLLALPLNSLNKDLRRGSQVLSDAQLQSVVAAPSVVATKRRITFLRFGVPTVYVVLALLVIFFGFPSHYR